MSIDEVEGMEEPRWYEADARLPGLTDHRHSMRDLSEEGVEGRMRAHYPEALAGAPDGPR